MCAGIALTMLLGICGQEPSEPDLLDFVKSQVAQYEIFVGDDLGQKTTLLDRPILLFSQPIQDPHKGGVFIWTRNGRPEALTRIVIHESRSRMDHTFSSLAVTRVEARKNGQRVWSPAGRHMELRPFPDAPQPAASAIRRLRQIRSMAAKFETELLHEGRISHPLRLLPRPLYRYNTPELQDGALFGLALGNDAKVIVLIETGRDDANGPGWYYTMAPVTVHGVRVSLDGTDVLQVPYRKTPYDPQEPYYLRLLRRPDF